MGLVFNNGNQYDEAVIALQRYIDLHPGNPDVAYAHYLRALSYYEQISDVARDQGNTEKALQGLEELVRRFPNSKYARDARLKIEYIKAKLQGRVGIRRQIEARILLEEIILNASIYLENLLSQLFLDLNRSFLKGQ